MAPFSISSFYDKSLVAILNSDNDPIIFHGIETTFNLKEINTKGRKIFIRLFGLEGGNDLNKNKFQLLKSEVKWHDFFTITKLNYEKDLISHFPILLTNQNETDSIISIKKKIRVASVAPFIGIPTYLGEQGTGNFCLFHGNLENTETEQAAYWLLDNVFNEIDIPLVIAGNNPSKSLEIAAHRQLNTCLVANPSSKERIELIKKAQLLILPEISSKLHSYDLIHSLIFGRHILSIQPNISIDPLKNLIHGETKTSLFKEKTINLFELTFSEDEKNRREAFLNQNLDDKKGAEKISKLLY